MSQPDAAYRVLIFAPRPVEVRGELSYATLQGLYDGLEAQGAALIREHLRPASAAALTARLGQAGNAPVDVLLLDAALAPEGQAPALLVEGTDAAACLPLDSLARDIMAGGRPLTILHLGGGADSMRASAFAEQLATLTGGPVLWLQPDLSQGLARACATELLAQLLAGEPLGASLETVLAAARFGVRRNGDPSAPLSLYGPAGWRLASRDASGEGIARVVPLHTRELGGPQERLPSPGEPGALPEEPEWGVQGRASEIVALEALLASHEPGPVWLYGYDGAGKTTLAAHVARWLVRTGRYERVVYTSIGRSGMPSVALYDLGRTLLGADFQVGPDAAEAVLRALEERPTLIVWDDLQAVLPGGDLGISVSELGEWYRMATQLTAAGASRVCLISDGPSLPDSARRLSDLRSLEIGLLGDDAATLLVAEVCQRLGAPLPEPDTIRQVVSAFGGHPLALRLIAAQFLTERPASLIDSLLTDLPSLARGEGRFRNQGLEIAFDRLSLALPDALREALPSLGLFAGGFAENIGAAFLGLEREPWEQAARPLFQSGLLAREPLAELAVSYVRLHPALKRLARQRLDQRARQRLRPGFCSLYIGLASWLLQTRETAPEQVHALAYHDLGNLNMALNLILEEQDLVLAVNYGRLYSHLLELLGLGEEAKRAAERVQEATTKAIPREGPMARPGVLLLWSQADRMIESGQLGAATTLLRQLLDRMNAQGGLSYIGREADLDRARTLRRLGRALRLGRRLDVAAVPVRRALEILERQDRDPLVWREKAEAHAELAETLMAAGQLQEAAQECQQGLQALEGLGDHAQEAAFYARLGMIAVRQDQTEEANAHYAQALERMQASDDAAGMAAVEGQLASLALRPPADLPRAREHLQRALAHARKSGNAVLVGQLLVQLAQVAAQGADVAEAEGLLRQAMDHYREQRITPGLIAAQANLAELLLQDGRAEQARDEAEAALQAAQEAGPNMAPWELCLLLQRIAEKRGDAADLARWRAATQDAFARSPQAAQLRTRWQSVIRAVVQGAQGEAMDAEAAHTIEGMESRADWQALGRAIMRILSGERGDSLWRDLDHIDATIVRTILEELEKPHNPEEADGSAA